MLQLLGKLDYLFTDQGNVKGLNRIDFTIVF